MIHAYSYLRFSTPGQEEGDSTRRQDALRDAWLKRHPDVRLVEELRDRGTSAFRGHHREEGHPLAEFIRLVESGRVAKGSYLLVENLDRLSREDPWVSVELLCSIVNAGVTVVTLSRGGMEFKRGNDLGPLVQAVIDFGRSNSESEMKAERLAAVWAQKKQDARESRKPIGKKHPAWIEVMDGEYRVKEDAGRAVRLIFKWCAEGRGTLSIKQRLEAEGVPPISYGKEWVRAYIAMILNNRAVLGEYQPMDRRKKDRAEGKSKKRIPDGDPIPGYYPTVVTEAEWHAAHAAMGARKGRSGRRGKKPNVFAGRLWCALDDCSMHVVVKKGVRYIVSRFAAEHRPGSHFRCFPLGAFTEAVLGQLRELNASDLFTDPGSSKVAEVAGRLMEVEKRLKVALERFEADPESPTWSAKVTQYDREKRALVAEQEGAKQQAATPLSEIWAEAVALMAESDPIRLRVAILATVEEVRCLVVPRGLNRFLYCQVFFKGTDERRAYLLWYTPRDGEKVEMKSQLWSEVETMPDLRKPAAVKSVEKLLLNWEL